MFQQDSHATRNSEDDKNNNIIFYSANIQVNKNLINTLYKVTGVQEHEN